jgi:RimJ/RimL family protein N-acetyltransferase
MMERETPLKRELTRDPVECDAKAPEKQVLKGCWVSVVPLDVARHGQALFNVSHVPEDGPALWEYLPYGPFSGLSEMTPWLEHCAASPDPFFYAILDEAGQPSGMASYLRIAPAAGSIEMGHIWMAPRIQRSRTASEALFLMMRHAFDDLGYRRLEWKCNAVNEASRRAAKRLGFSYEGTFYRNMIVKGRNRDTAWYALLLEDWRGVREGFEAWLDLDNFDENGNQKKSLSDLMPRQQS